jgi:putative SOS response-associated peptidase YedK
MCGRFTLTGSLNWLFRLLGISKSSINIVDRFNIAPSSPVLVFVKDPDSNILKQDFHLWGLVPPFFKNPLENTGFINARCESIDRKPSFKNAFKYRRCIIPASGFYEWENLGAKKQPWYFFPAKEDESHLCFAGLWEVWHGPDGEQLNSCAIITTKADNIVGKIHQRMPVILKHQNILEWLNLPADDQQLKKMLCPADDNVLNCHRVTTRVNYPGFDELRCIEPEPELQPNLF